MTRKPPENTNDAGKPDNFRSSMHAVARRMLRDRTVFERMFPSGYIRDPIMESLLTLYLGSEQRSLATATAPPGSRRSTDSADRWLAVLLDDGLAERQGVFVILTTTGTALVEQALSELVA